MDILEYYSRKDVQKALVKFAKEREIAIKFGDKGFGKRPDILQYEEDVAELAKQGATSFHVSEEHWKNPLLLKTGMSKKELDTLRAGWDLVIDIDGKNLGYSTEAGKLILDVLRFYSIKNILIKFSGNKGWHIIVPFLSFPDKVNEIEIKDFFPDGLKIIVQFINYKIEPFLKENLKSNTPFDLVDIDAGLISSRHMIRAPYSLNEKSGFVSIFVESIESFDLLQAKLENVKVINQEFDETRKGEASGLMTAALDWYARKNRNKEIEKTEFKGRKFELPEEGIMAEYWPPCINLIIKGVEDGRKRALFILYNFLRSIGYNVKDIEAIVIDWNKRNKEALPENYVKSQLNWFKKIGEVRLPPNCDNQNYCLGIGVCKPDNFCVKIKNPANYALLKKKVMNKGKKKRKKQ